MNGCHIWEMTREEKIEHQRLGFAIKACHDMGKTVEEAAACLACPEPEICIVYDLISENKIDFESPFTE